MSVGPEEPDFVAAFNFALHAISVGGSIDQVTGMIRFAYRDITFGEARSIAQEARAALAAGRQLTEQLRGITGPPILAPVSTIIPAGTCQAEIVVSGTDRQGRRLRLHPYTVNINLDNPAPDIQAAVDQAIGDDTQGFAGSAIPTSVSYYVSNVICGPDIGS